MPDSKTDMGGKAGAFDDFEISPEYTGELPKILLYLARLEKGDLELNIMKNLGLERETFMAGRHYLHNAKAIDWYAELSEEDKTFEMRWSITKIGIEQLQSYKAR